MPDDEMCKGRVILYDLEAQISEKEQNMYKMEELVSKELKGPVTAVAPLEGYLMASMGPKLYVFYFDWNVRQLIQCSFFDTQFFIVSLTTVKNYVLYGDAFKSVHLLRWREHGRRLTELGKDQEPLQVVRSDYLVHDSQLFILVNDHYKNMQLFAFSGNQQLFERVADYHVNVHVRDMVRMRSRRSRSQHLVLTAGLDGSIAMWTTVDDAMHRRLASLQQKMYTQIAHRAGLHPKAYRLFYTGATGMDQGLVGSNAAGANTVIVHKSCKKKVIDGQLLWRYIHLDSGMQRDLARQIGSQADKIIDNLQEIQEHCFYF